MSRSVPIKKQLGVDARADKRESVPPERRKKERDNSIIERLHVHLSTHSIAHESREKKRDRCFPQADLFGQRSTSFKFSISLRMA